ncbi:MULTISPECIES: hypothetical protein [unclassified Polynucleobacter]|uniref:hypothetical protein n=1 Tax=unclassified Polynucleobacter TaxID=2640945 RepID=UPI001F2805C8|nr:MULTISPECIES: hypothetical protein [unclassified Polynucleobacter]MCE7526572.1 hypothetical protein [Polynucleobacter sp. IMCC 30228]MCE7529857.1 hypothetical protein [Polynucleobacter sp. IMCC 29146]
MPNFSFELLISYLVCYCFMAQQLGYVLKNYHQGIPERIAENDLVARLGDKRGRKLARDLALFFKYLFPSYVVIEALIGVAYLLILGIAKGWLLPLILYGMGLLMQFGILKLEALFPAPNRAWIMSLLGLLVLPLMLTYMMRFIY